MFTRLILRSAVHHTSYQVAKVLAKNNIKQCFKFSTFHFSPAIGQLTRVLRRHYCKESAPETLIVDYEYVRNSIADSSKLIVDVREPEEIKEHGMIPNSINIPLGCLIQTLTSMSECEFKRLYKKPKPCEDTVIIFYCMVGKRAGLAQKNAYNLGYRNSRIYLGSWSEWKTKYEFQKPKKYI